VQEKDEQIQYVKEKYDSEIALLKFVTRTAFVRIIISYHSHDNYFKNNFTLAILRILP
jgi:hypothetical protein